MLGFAVREDVLAVPIEGYAGPGVDAICEEGGVVDIDVAAGAEASAVEGGDGDCGVADLDYGGEGTHEGVREDGGVGF